MAFYIKTKHIFFKITKNYLNLDKNKLIGFQKEKLKIVY